MTCWPVRRSVPGRRSRRDDRDDDTVSSGRDLALTGLRLAARLSSARPRSGCAPRVRAAHAPEVRRVVRTPPIATASLRHRSPPAAAIAAETPPSVPELRRSHRRRAGVGIRADRHRGVLEHPDDRRPGPEGQLGRHRLRRQFAGHRRRRPPVATTATAAPPTYQAENFLLVGSDTRSGANNIDDSEGRLDGVANTDSIMLLHISADRQRIYAVSMPRDMWVPNVECNSYDQTTNTYGGPSDANEYEKMHINAFYGTGGPKCLVDAVENLTQLNITHYIQIDFSGFQAMVDALGGITVNVCRPIIDETLGTVSRPPVSRRINGATALSLARARKVQGDTESDLARIHRQQIILSTILRNGEIGRRAARSGQARRFRHRLHPEHHHGRHRLQLADDAGRVARQPRPRQGHVLHHADRRRSRGHLRPRVDVHGRGRPPRRCWTRSATISRCQRRPSAGHGAETGAATTGAGRDTRCPSPRTRSTCAWSTSPASPASRARPRNS